MASFLDTAQQIAREAGALLMTHYGKIGFELKGDFDLVTAADRASEHLIIDRLRSHYPAHAILGEEHGAQEGRSEYRWFVDPLDGTTNFAHSYPVFNVSMGLAKGDELIAGVVYDPTRPEMFAAEKGAGAYLNNRKIRVSRTEKLEEALCSTGFPSRKRHLNINIHFYHQLAMITHGVRRGGAAAIDLAYVASGRLDAFWEFSLNPWDVAAGLLIVDEAGGRTTDMKGGPSGLRVPHLLATNGTIHEKTLALFGEVFRGEYRYAMPVVG
jgi:myo-inositol-1(or 4)-monophosphatase